MSKRQDADKMQLLYISIVNDIVALGLTEYTALDTILAKCNSDTSTDIRTLLGMLRIMGSNKHTTVTLDTLKNNIMKFVPCNNSNSNA